MGKKLLLFNYFTQKLVDFEMNVLKIPTFELALSNLLLCENLHPVMPQGWVENGSRIYASKMPVRYFSNKSYLQSLLFVVCMWDIDEKSGKHLLFDVFNNFSSNRLGFFDWELQQQISGFYKIAYPSEGNLLPPELLPLQRIEGKGSQEPENFLVAQVSKLELPQKCEETEHIDKALDDLFQLSGFIRAFANEEKPVYLTRQIADSEIHRSCYGMKQRLNRLNLEKYKNSFFKGDEYKRPQEAINARHFLAERFQIQKENA